MVRYGLSILVSMLVISLITVPGNGYSNPNPQPQQEYGVPGQTPGQPLGLDQMQSQTQGQQQYGQERNSGCPPNDPEANKALILQMYDILLGQKNVENIDRYFAEDTLEHNPYVADGREARRLTLINGTISGPPVNIEIQRIIAGEEFVWVHSRFPILNLKSVFAAVDIYRFRCGLIVEHWDVLQNIKLNQPSLNDHPFF